jgi:secreted PhoX family phosphatase
MPRSVFQRAWKCASACGNLSKQHHRAAAIMSLSRRSLIQAGIASIGTFMSAQMLWALPAAKPGKTAAADWPSWGPLKRSNLLHLWLPEGFSARVVARSGEKPVRGKNFSWHNAPDGGACFATDDGGWIYVSNSEVSKGKGGASALRFNASAELVDAYSILQGTNRNCAGGATPWQTWLSCEEPDSEQPGYVYECDPWGKAAAIQRPALGHFCHEAVAVDLHSGALYLTEDVVDGCLYRFLPASANTAGKSDLHNGELQVACPASNGEHTLEWLTVPDPSARSKPTRYQVPTAARFAGGEGIVWHQGTLYFTTKHDNRLWQVDTASQQWSILYDAARFDKPVLRGVDNLAVTCSGDILVAEDSDDMQIVAVNAAGQIQPLLQIQDHDQSEITGPAFDPSGQRLYFSSQRGRMGSTSGAGGVTYEVTGPFACAGLATR